jgi:hypothetical protein
LATATVQADLVPPRRDRPREVERPKPEPIVEPQPIIVEPEPVVPVVEPEPEPVVETPTISVETPVEPDTSPEELLESVLQNSDLAPEADAAASESGNRFIIAVVCGGIVAFALVALVILRNGRRGREQGDG